MLLNHVSIQCNDTKASHAFYDAVLAELGAGRIMEHDDVVGYGTLGSFPELWVGPFDSGDGFRETHLAFTARDRDAVDAFFAAAVAQGAEVLYEPKLWPEYAPTYYAAFVRDPDGNNVEAACM
ncbi:MAG: VOC family protein [Propionibacteriaceae bacterium]|jgi:catechol 2,3-dioxygenase-like lactoylglutathione lyase family enzyme|nr:VOC family protein [Propionibacteriaceae bacterium]